MAAEPEATSANLTPETETEAAPETEEKPARKVVQMSCRMPHCESMQHYVVRDGKEVSQRVYECVGCGNVWSANLGGNPGF